ncbi:signal peptide peptidase SppA [Treponema pectinovorum]|uniref:signal peptide peptidase SppA n=1 Tax=Treponema pectinovorum TaxID=164 RepID=UPI0011C96B23|nr:signal peptide peptidase SppA [Treponema pectinovorum]
MKDKNTKKGLIVLLLIVAVAITMGTFKLVSKKSDNLLQSERFTSKKIVNFNKKLKPYIAVIYINGVIQEKGNQYNQAWLLDKIESLKNDEKNKGILLFIDSPGGAVYQSDEAYLKLIDYKNTGKKIYSYFGSLAASGGYYIALAGDKIFANRNTLTGSIGVISASTIDATALLEKIGIKSLTIHAGKNKNMFNYNEKATDEQIKIMQSIADEAYEQFTQIVSESRKMNIKKVQQLADGRIYTAKQAKELNLIDEICTFEQAKNKIKEDFDNNELNFKGFRYEKNENLRSLLFESLSFIKSPQSVFLQNAPLSYIYIAK